ncbi:stage V sporulation protein B [Calderihabitans maritimus]|uniref:Stage V sporulation protein B n=1 Tax=Calderihabitans maritimus TaxID=1246530 RepID=A0A1Z5HXG9_9FIRM|nr:stage V sporulation protein B [Calderihabitans maritimus]GAW94229.1 stage V sporulation protein B [Calderihabitans maritimus]
MKKQPLIYGAAILVAASFFNRVIGFIYRVLVVRLIGPEGIGIYEMVFPVYVLLLVITTAGIPLATSKLVAEEMALGNVQGAYRIFRVALTFLTAFGVVITFICYLFVSFIADRFFADPRAYWIFLVMLPGIPIISICSAFRGFFQGIQQMTPTAITQILEQCTRVAIGLYLAYRFLPRGVEYAAMGMGIGTVMGELSGLLLMTSIYAAVRPRLFPRIRESLSTFPLLTVLNRLFSLGIPVTISRVITTVVMTLQAFIIPIRLQAAGFSLRQATEMYGNFSGIALTLLHLPTIFTVSLGISLVPAISEAIAERNLSLAQSRSHEALRLTLLLGLPSAVILYLMPDQLSRLIFAAPQAAVPLKVLALASPFLYLQQTTTGILQGSGQVTLALTNIAFGAIINLTAVYLLTGIPSLNIRGTAIAANLNFVTVGLLNLLALIKTFGLSLDLRQVILSPLLAMAAMVSVIHSVANYLSSFHLNLWGHTLLPIAAGSVTYVFMLVLTGGITRQDFNRIVRMLNQIYR